MERSSSVRTSVLAALLLTALAQRATADTACFSTHTSNDPSAIFFKICLSQHGNLVRFESPEGLEHIRVGQIAEGYLLCSGAPAKMHGYDAGYAEQGFGDPTITQPGGPNTFPLTIERNTTDGVFRLIQTFDWQPVEREVSITMRIKNRSDQARRHVQVFRYFDGDMNGTEENDDYEGTTFSAYATEHGRELTALSLNALTFGVTYVYGSSIPKAFWDPKDCKPSPFGDNPEDGVGFVFYDVGTIAAGKAKSFNLLYRAF